MEDRPFETINVVPLVDIMLVLLTIVLTTATFISTGKIPIALPQVPKADAEKSKDRIIEISAAGELFLGGARLSREALEEQLHAFPTDSGVTIRADRDIRFQIFIEVADMLKRLKISRVSIQTQGVAR